MLAYPKFKLRPEQQQELLADYRPYCMTVQFPRPPSQTPPCRHAFDAHFLQLALAGKAKALISGERDLLALVDQFSCPIVTADQLWGSLT